MSVDKVRGEIINIGRFLIARELTVGSSGNISVRVSDEKIVVTPSGISFEAMSPEDLIVVDIHGNVVEGDRNPSIELPMHLTIYRNRSDVNAIIHAHTIFCSALAATHTSIPPILDEMVLYIGGEISVAEYALPGSEELARNTLKALGNKKAVILANHGVVVCGRDLRDALEVLLRVERIARIYILARLIGEPKRLPNEAIEHEMEMYELLLLKQCP